MLLFLTGLSGQDLSYRGKISVKTFKTDNHISKGVQAKVLANLNNLPLSEFDTLYRTHYICEDTIVIYITGVDQLHQSREIQIGSKSYLYDNQTFTFIQLPLMERSFSGITARDWKRYKKRAEISKFDYDYQLIHPRRKSLTYFAALDESVQYPEQLKLEGQFGLLFHPLGRYEILVSRQDSMEYVNLYTYERDPKLNCQEHFTDFAIRDPEIDMDQLPGYRPDLEVIPESDRLPILATQLRDTSRYGIPSFDEFAGKYVYIDLWASWCAPCRAEMPFLKSIRENYPEEKLVILSISMDSKADRDKWWKMIAKMEMNWINWIIYDGLRSDFAKANKVQGIPHYLLLDQEGRIMNANAPRPSDERLQQMLDKILNK